MSQTDQYQPKWRHFHPQTRIWVQNILDHDVTFQVADERGVQQQYTLPQGLVSELPGGSIATLGVKAIVDELVSKDDMLKMWEPSVRAGYEAQIIIREDTPRSAQASKGGGPINLASKIDLDEFDLNQPEDAKAEDVVEEEFPDLKDQVDESVKAKIDNIANASASGPAQVVEEA